MLRSAVKVFFMFFALLVFAKAIGIDPVDGRVFLLIAVTALVAELVPNDER